MGYYKHNAIIVTTAHKTIAMQCIDRAEDLGLNPSSLMESDYNTFYSFLIPPDGSKEGRIESDEYDVKRRKLKDHIGDCADWIEVAYGGDNPISVSFELPEADYQIGGI